MCMRVLILDPSFHISFPAFSSQQCCGSGMIFFRIRILLKVLDLSGSATLAPRKTLPPLILRLKSFTKSLKTHSESSRLKCFFYMNPHWDISHRRCWSAKRSQGSGQRYEPTLRQAGTLTNELWYTPYSENSTLLRKNMLVNNDENPHNFATQKQLYNKDSGGRGGHCRP